MKVTDILKGDKITVTITNGDRKTIYTGVADHDGGSLRWRTADDYPLWTDNAFAVIELLDRPTPKIVLPSKPGATIIFNKARDSFEKKRVSTLDERGNWQSHYPNGEWRDGRSSAALAEWFENGEATDLKVLFEGVAK